MSAGRSMVDLIVVTVGALGFVSLLLYIQGKQHGRARGEIVRALVIVWAALAGMLAAVFGLRPVLGELFEVQLAGGAPIIWRSLGPAEIAVLVGLIAITIVLYAIASRAVRRLLAPPGLEVGPHPGDEEGDG